MPAHKGFTKFILNFDDILTIRNNNSIEEYGVDTNPVINNSQEIPEEDFSIEEITSDTSSKCDVKCQQCGEKRRIEWLPGMECPACGSKNYFPVIKIDPELEKQNESSETLKKIQKKTITLHHYMKDFSLKKCLSYVAGIIIALVWIKIGWFIIAQNLAKPKTPVNLRWKYTCSICNHSFVDIPKIPPVECKKCHRNTADVVFKCRECKAVFPLRNKAREPHCPFCLSPRITTYRISQTKEGVRR
ncbi:MAG: hypothetical protein AB1454_03600 [Candidatus Auribacterota bacterium]